MRNSLAWLLPVAQALFYFAFGVPHDVFAYECRVANTISYGTISGCLEEFSEQEAKIVKELGRDLTQGGIIVLDDVQNYLIQRDPRVGRTNKMNIGLAATYVELDNIHPQAFSLDDKIKWLMVLPRCNLKVEDFIRLIDQPHLDDIMSLHWLLTLVNYIHPVTQLYEEPSSCALPDPNC